MHADTHTHKDVHIHGHIHAEGSSRRWRPAPCVCETGRRPKEVEKDPRPRSPAASTLGPPPAARSCSRRRRELCAPRSAFCSGRVGRGLKVCGRSPTSSSGTDPELTLKEEKPRKGARPLPAPAEERPEDRAAPGRSHGGLRGVPHDAAGAARERQRPLASPRFRVARPESTGRGVAVPLGYPRSLTPQPLPALSLRPRTPRLPGACAARGSRHPTAPHSALSGTPPSLRASLSTSSLPSSRGFEGTAMPQRLE